MKASTASSFKYLLFIRKSYSFITNIVLIPNSRNKGVGKELVSTYEKICKENKIRFINCLVHKDNKKMLSFCDKNGIKKGLLMYYFEKEIR